ncbi:MAG TPA: Gfo/Idh/MocA family oxidoreductase [Steroidobacteraceae bacterium]|jgi:predicted dehydrogenase|nr:Gfo/Idh/MocA family oxidoreductase [Steroidobacteraceae bacterium]
MSNPKDLSRREFVAGAGQATLAMVAAGAPLIVPRRVLGRGMQAPSDTVNIAVVGFGSMGSQNAQVMAQTDRIGAVCDVDLAYSERCVAKLTSDAQNQPRPLGLKLKEQFDKAKRYTDFREMLAKEKNIDAVLIATADHMHAAAAKAAMEAGKHVYVQKPLTATVHESRMLREHALKNPKLVTQMGNQGHSSEGARLINEWIGAGIIGAVHDVHVWTNRPVVYWPQGLARPTSVPAVEAPGGFGNPWTFRYLQDVLAAAMGDGGAPPPGLDWNLYLGASAENVPYHPVYHPFNWRGWLAFGCGALGDMGAHLIDHPFWALGLTHPTSIEATSTQWGTMPLPPTDPAAAAAPPGRIPRTPVSYPISTCVHYQFAARGASPPVKLSWFDGGIYPPRPDLLPDDVTLRSEGGVIFIGEKGILLHDTYGSNPRLYPQSLTEAAAAVPKSMPRIMWSHELNWIKAIRGEAKASSPLEYAAQLTETMLLGLVALRAGQGKKILYDGESGQITNHTDANQYLTREYRAGWNMQS